MTEETLEARILTLEQEVLELLAQRVIVRDIAARLLAYLADGRDDPEALLRHFSESGDLRIDVNAGQEDAVIAIAEVCRREKDWIVDVARNLVASADGLTAGIAAPVDLGVLAHRED